MNTLAAQLIIKVAASRELFRFCTFREWVNTASWRWESAGVRSGDTLCVDTQGRVCKKGAEFMRARDDKTFPIIVYEVV